MSAPGDTGDRRGTVAVVGSGVAGLTAAHLLSRTHDVTLIEADDRLGGHAHTHQLPDGVAVDSGFIVHNRRNYPLLVGLFDELGVETRATEMSMSISCRSCGLSYCGGRGASGLFAQPRRLTDPRFLGMLSEVRRFHRRAREVLTTASDDLTWSEFLRAGRHSDYFVDHFATPLVSCVWSSGEADSGLYPARHLFEFLDNHGMLSVGGSPSWRTVVGGSRVYVDALAERLKLGGAQIRTGSPVQSLVRHDNHIELRTPAGVEHFDRVVVAVHADQALELLTDANADERANLSAIGYSHNHTVLHHDESLLPERRRARASWNHRVACREDDGRRPVQVSYWMNRLMGIPGSRQYVVSLNPAEKIAPERVIAEMDYSHPVFTPDAVRAARRLQSGGGPRLAFAGAHFGWGFHEDGCRSGYAAAAKFGAPL
jgi:predicted NAD/FAD-binding protein